MNPEPFIYPLPNGFHSLIDGCNFLTLRTVPRNLAFHHCRTHVLAILREQDGEAPIQRTLAERRNIYNATACP